MGCGTSRDNAQAVAVPPGATSGDVSRSRSSRALTGGSGDGAASSSAPAAADAAGASGASAANLAAAAAEAPGVMPPRPPSRSPSATAAATATSNSSSGTSENGPTSRPQSAATMPGAAAGAVQPRPGSRPASAAGPSARTLSAPTSNANLPAAEPVADSLPAPKRAPSPGSPPGNEQLQQHAEQQDAEARSSTKRQRCLEQLPPPLQPPCEVWHCAVSLAFLQRFAADVVQPGWTTYDILQKVVLPATSASKCRYVDTLPAAASSTLTYFVSYAWSMPFTTLVALLSHQLHAADPERVFCWVDVLAINQHPGQQQAADLRDLEEAVRLAEGTLVCLDPACTPFTRVWCLFEWWTTLRLRGLRRLAFLAEPATRRRMSDLYATIDVRKAQATVASDRDRILGAIGQDQLETVNAQLKLVFLLEPHDTTLGTPYVYGTLSPPPPPVAAAAAAAAAAATPAVPGGREEAGVTGGGGEGGEAQLWARAAVERWLALPPTDSQYRALLVTGPVGCGKTHGAASALAAAMAAAEAAAAPPPGPSASRPGSRPASGATSTAAPPAPPAPPPRRRRAAAVHFCRTSDAPSRDAVVMVRSLAFQLACSGGYEPLGALLRRRFLGLSREGIANLGIPDLAFNLLLGQPLLEVMAAPPGGAAELGDDDDGRPPPRWLVQQRELAAAAAPEEVVLLVDGLDEAEGPGGGAAQEGRQTVLMALRDLFPRLPSRVRLLFTSRARPTHSLRCVVAALAPSIVAPEGDDLNPARNPLMRLLRALLAKHQRQQQLQQQQGVAGGGMAGAAAEASADVAAGGGKAAPKALPPVVAPASPGAALAALFGGALQRLSPAQAEGVGAVLELLLASREPPSLSAIKHLGLASALPGLPGWAGEERGAAAAAADQDAGVWAGLFAGGGPRGGFRLRVVHRAVIDWLATAAAAAATAVGTGGKGGSSGGAAAAAAPRRSGGGGGAAAAAAAAALAAAGVQVDVARGHRRLADWALADLRGSLRPQASSLRHAVYHLAHAAAAATAAASASATPPSATPAAPPEAVRQRDEAVRQLEGLLLDLDYWRQVYESRLGAAVLRDLLSLPGLTTPAARDVVRLIQRDHAALEAHPDRIANLAFETPLASATRAAAARYAAAKAAASAGGTAAGATTASKAAAAGAAAPTAAATTSAAAAAATAAAPVAAQHSGDAGPAVGPPRPAWPCTVVSPVVSTWPAGLAVVVGEQPPNTRAGITGVAAAKFAPGGATFVSCNSAGSVLLYDVRTRERVLHMRGHVGAVHGVDFLVLDPDTAHAQRRPLPPLQGSGGGGSAANVAASAAAAAAAPAAEEEEEGHEEEGQAYEGDEEEAGLKVFVVSCGSDGSVRLWDSLTGEEALRLQEVSGHVAAVAATRGGEITDGGGGSGGYVAALSEDGKLVIWRVHLEPRPTDHAPAGPQRSPAPCVQPPLPPPPSQVPSPRAGSGTLGAKATTPMPAAGAVGSPFAASGAAWTGPRTRSRPAAALLHTQEAAHAGAGSCVAFAPGGRMLATGGKDARVKLWDVASGRLVAELDVSPATGVFLPPYPAAPASDASAPAVAAPLSARQDHQGQQEQLALLVKCVSFSSDGSTLLAGLHSGEVRVYEAKGAGAATIAQAGSAAAAGAGAAGSSGGAKAAAVAAIKGAQAGAAAAAGGGNGEDVSVSAWALRCSLMGHTGQVLGAAASPDGRRLFTCSVDKSVRVWDAESGCSLAELSGHQNHVNALDASDDGSRLVTASADGTVRIWDAALAATASPPSRHAGGIMQAAVATHNSYVVTASEDKTVCVWALPLPSIRAPAAPPPTLRSPPPPPADAAATTTTASASLPHPNASAASPWPPSALQVRPPPPIQRPPSATLHPSSSVRPRSSPTAGQPLQGTGSTMAAAPQAAAAGDSARVSGSGSNATGASVPSLEVSDDQLGCSVKLTGHEALVSSVALACDEVTLASGSYDKTIRVWRLDQPGTEPLVLRSAHRGFVMALAFDAWGTRLVSAGDDGSLAVWDAAAWQSSHFSPPSPGGTHKASPAASRRASASAAGAAGNASARSSTGGCTCCGSPLRSETAPGITTTWALACSPNSYLVAGGHGDHTLAVWDCLQPGTDNGGTTSGSSDASGKAGEGEASASSRRSLLVSVHRPEDVPPGGGHVYGVAWGPDGRLLAGGYSGRRSGGRARVWDVAAGTCVADFEAHGGDVWGVAFDSTGHLLATCSYDANAAVWDVRDLRAPKRQALLKGHSAPLRSIAFLTRGCSAAAAVPGGGGSTADGGGGGGGAAGGGADASRWIMTSGNDATVRVWSYDEAVRQGGEVSYYTPWAVSR